MRSGLIGLGLVAVSGAGIALRGTATRPLPRGGLKVFTPEEYAILAAIADRVCPPPGSGKKTATDLDVAGIADAAFEHADDDVKQGLKLGLRIIENALAGALFFERVTPFTKLSPDDQDAVLLAFRDSRVPLRRTLFRAFSGLCASLYYGNPETFASVGYPGPPDAGALRAAYSDQLVDFRALRARTGGG